MRLRKTALYKQQCYLCPECIKRGEEYYLNPLAQNQPICLLCNMELNLKEADRLGNSLTFSAEPVGEGRQTAAGE